MTAASVCWWPTRMKFGSLRSAAAVPFGRRAARAPGAHWAARRVPDDQVYTGANRSRLGVIDFNDTENYMWSTNITDLPEQMGWWSEGEDFNFTQIFNPEPYGYESYASRREWRVFSLLAPSQEFPVLDNQSHYDFTIKPDELVSIQDIMDIYSDHLEGTEYDMTQGLAANWPVRQSPPLAAGQRRQAGECRQRGLGARDRPVPLLLQLRGRVAFRYARGDRQCAVVWPGFSDTTVYTPIYAGTTAVPEEWSSGDRKSFDQNCAWWAFNFIGNYAQLNWNAMYPVIREKKAAIESEYFAAQADVDAKALELYFLRRGSRKGLSDRLCEHQSE